MQELGHHYKQAVVSAPPNPHPSILKRVDTFLWDSLINGCTVHGYGNGLTSISESSKPNLYTAVIFAFLPAASQGEMYPSPVFTSDTDGGEGNRAPI